MITVETAFGHRATSRGGVGVNDHTARLGSVAPTTNGAADAMLRSAVEGVFVLDRDHQIISFSEGCERLTGYPKAEVLGSRCRCHEAMNGHGEHGASLTDALCPGMTVYHGEVPSAIQRMGLTHRSGDTVWVDTLYSPLHDDAGRVIGVVGVMRPTRAPANTAGTPANGNGQAMRSIPIETRGNGEAPEAVEAGAQSATGEGVLDGVLLNVERREILSALRRARGQRARAARALGISRSRLYRRMEVLGIDPRADV